MMIRDFLALLCTAVLLMSCASTSTREASEKNHELPKWTKLPPREEGYFFGIGCDKDLNKAKQKAIVNVGQVISTKVASSVAVHTSSKENSYKSMVETVHTQLTDETVQGAKYVDQYQDTEGQYWVLARAPLDCILDVTEGVLLSYRMEMGQELESFEIMFEEIETEIYSSIDRYHEDSGSVYGRTTSIPIQNAILDTSESENFHQLAAKFQPGGYTLSVKVEEKYRELFSRLVIGYDAGRRSLVPIGMLETEDDSPSLILTVNPKSPAVGNPIWIRAELKNSSSEFPWIDYVDLDFNPFLMKLRQPDELIDTEPHTYTVEDGSIDIDGKLEDWMNIPVYYQDEIGDARHKGTDLSYIKAAMDSDRAYFLLVSAEEKWGADITFEINFDYIPGMQYQSSRIDSITDIHTNIRRTEVNFWEKSLDSTPYDPGVRQRTRGNVFEFSVPLRRYECEWFNIYYANIWIRDDSSPSDKNILDYAKKWRP